MRAQDLFEIGTAIFKKGFETYFLCSKGSKEIRIVLFIAEEQGIVYGLEYENMNPNRSTKNVDLLYMGHLFTDKLNVELEFYIMAKAFDESLFNRLLSSGAEILIDDITGKTTTEQPKEVMQKFAQERQLEIIEYRNFNI